MKPGACLIMSATNTFSKQMLKVDALHNWIGQLSPPANKAVIACMRPRHYDDGEAVYALGEEGSELYLIESGRVRFCNYTSRGKEIEFAELREGDCFGELSLIDGLYRPHCTFAAGPTALRVLHKRDFDLLCVEYPEIFRQLTRLMAHHLRQAYTMIEDATVLPMKDRLARLLSRLAYSFGKAEHAGATLLEGVTHESLARMLGSTREGVSRELKQLETAGLIRREYGKILIPDLAALIAASDAMVGGEALVPGYR